MASYGSGEDRTKRILAGRRGTDPCAGHPVVAAGESVFGHFSRCLCLVLLYDGMVTSVPACQIVGRSRPRGCK